MTLVEAQPRLGGAIHTERADGLILEGGPDSFLSHKARGVGLCREIGLGDRLTEASRHAPRAYIKRRGKLYPLPEGMTGLAPARLVPLLRSPLLSPSGKARAAMDLLLPPKAADGDESIADFVRRRLGNEAYDWLCEPLLGGLYAGQGEQLSLAAAFPQLRQAERERGSLLRGSMTAVRQTAPNGVQSPFITLTSGMGELVEALEARLQRATVLRDTRALRIGMAGRPIKYELILQDGSRLRADAVILAAPAHAAAELIVEQDEVAANILRDIPYASTAVVNLAYPRAEISHPLKGHGYVVPRAEGSPVTACTWSSAKFPRRAPDDWALLRVFIGRAGDDRALVRTDEQLVEIARDEVRKTMGIAATPSLTRLFRWPRAMPQYTLGHLERAATLERRLLAHPGLFVAGSAYRGVGLPDCIASGERAAESAIHFLEDLAT